MSPPTERTGPRQEAGPANTTTANVPHADRTWRQRRIRRVEARQFAELLGLEPPPLPPLEPFDWHAAGLHLGVREREAAGRDLARVGWFG